MRTITIELPDELDERLRHEAVRRSITFEELIVEILSLRLHYGLRQRTFRSIGAGYSGEGNLSVRVEEILDEEWEQHIDPDGHRRRRSS